MQILSGFIDVYKQRTKQILISSERVRHNHIYRYIYIFIYIPSVYSHEFMSYDPEECDF